MYAKMVHLKNLLFCIAFNFARTVDELGTFLRPGWRKKRIIIPNSS